MKRTIVLVLVVALGVVAGVAKADFVFGTPTNLGVTANNSNLDGEPSISADGLSLYFCSIRPGGHGSGDIYVTTRATVSDPWGEPVNLGPAVNSSAWDGEPSISSDGLSLYFGSQRSGGYGGADIWVTTRATTSDPWGEAVNLGPTINTEADDVDECISADGLSLYIDSFREGGHGGTDLWVATRETLSDLWQEPVNLGTAVNGLSGDSAPSISADGRVLFFSDFFDPRPGGQGDADLWMTIRATVSDPWGEPVNLGPAVNSSALDAHPDISTDGSTLYFSSGRPGSAGFAALWQVSITAAVDFNSDGKVDLKDYSRLAQYWQQNERSVDMAPTPLGDGVVDVQDVAVLAEYWLTELSLVAHWRLDETEGYMAHDSAGDHDAFVIGPIWQPTNGKVDGALEFDGIDDYVGTPFVLNPAQGSFSVFLWVKGGLPGQVILSQKAGTDWLYTLSPMGWLMSHLGGTLLSQTVVTDGQWHRIGLACDGTKRILYVDGVNVAEGTPAGLAASQHGLYLGAGKDLDAGTFLSGLIDDVKIYNRAIVP